MMQLRLFLLFVGVSFFHHTQAQIPDYQGQQPFAQVGLRFNAYVDPLTSEIDDQSIVKEGSPYSSPNFEYGWVLLKNAADSNKMDLRYNYFFNELVWKKKEGEYYNLLKTSIQAFGLYESDLVFVHSSVIGLADDAFLNQVYEGELVAVYLKNVIDKKVIEPEPYGASKKEIKFINKKELFLQINEEVIPIEGKKQLNKMLEAYGIAFKKLKYADLQDHDILSAVGKELDEVVGTKG